jgi:hypothetical protein
VLFLQQYVHDHLKVVHCLTNENTVLITRQIPAKLLDYTAAYLATGKISDQATNFQGDVQQLIQLLLSILGDVCPCDCLTDIEFNDFKR